ncbi:MAG: heparinase II/III family protein [Desulfobacteraceae bacterium]|nr:heparinase II/III family protein [Desulfobacteraceae bacterium]
MRFGKIIEKAGWYLARLQLMSLPEVFFRIRRAISNRLERAPFRPALVPPAPDLRLLPSAMLIPDPSGIDPAPYIACADDIVRGRLGIFEKTFTLDGPCPEWNRDPLTGLRAPLCHGKSLDYRNPDRVGNIKYLWELNRHTHLVTLAQAYRLTGGSRYLATLSAHLRSWLDQCPYPLGPNWSSSLELGLRIINWCFVWHLAGGERSELFSGEEGRRLRNDWLNSIYLHARFIAGYLSLYSSANNHLIGEAAGLFVAGTVWPLWKASEPWREMGGRILISEARAQNWPDGVNKEQAVAYQHYETDLLLISALIGKAHSFSFPGNYRDVIEKMLEYFASIMDVSGNIPMFGDSDDAIVVRLSREKDFCVYRSLLSTGAVLYNRADFRAKAGRLDDKTRWLLGCGAEPQSGGENADSAVLPVRRDFSSGGYYILGADFETPEEIRLIADAGPLGYLSIAAHGHADALSFALFAGGKEFLVDPGTYAFHTNKAWRDYFRGTSAHNTVRIDGRDQSVIGGNFMWLRKANARCYRWESGDALDRFGGVHDGYSRLPDPVVHYREIELHKDERLIVVTDILQCTGHHRVEQFWHFPESCSVAADETGIVAENGGIVLALRPKHARPDIEVLRGSYSPIGGWVSRKLDVKVPATTVVFRSAIDGLTRLDVELDLSFSKSKAKR